VERKNLEDPRLKFLSRELAAEVHEANLRTQATELVDRERQLAERQMRERQLAERRLAPGSLQGSKFHLLSKGALILAK
jgi:hypothetical protein